MSKKDKKSFLSSIASILSVIFDKDEGKSKEEKRITAYKRIAIGLVAFYLFMDFYILHVKVYRYINPHANINTMFSGGLKHMFAQPFNIFPIPPGTGNAILWVTAFTAIVFGLIVLDFKLRAHDDPDTVQGDAKWLKNLTEYNK